MWASTNCETSHQGLVMDERVALEEQPVHTHITTTSTTIPTATPTITILGTLPCGTDRPPRVVKLMDGNFNTTVVIKAVTELEFTIHELLGKYGDCKCTPRPPLAQCSQIINTANPGVIEVLKTLMSPVGPYVVLEYARQGDLLDWVMNHGPFHVKGVCCLTMQLLKGLRHIHKLGIAHLDIKPENILVFGGARDDGKKFMNVKLADFGLSWVVWNAITPLPDYCAIMCPNNKTGTKAYMSPERLTDHAGTFCGKKADVWSLGVVVSILMYGTPIIAEATTACKRYRYLETNRPTQLLNAMDRSLSSFKPRLHWSDLQTTLMMMLYIQPHLRVGVAVLLNMFRTILGGAGAVAPTGVAGAVAPTGV